MKPLLTLLAFLTTTLLSAQWVQQGADIDGESFVDQSGGAVSMPDPHTIAIGAVHNFQNGGNAGHVRVYRLTGNTWIQKGIDIDGDSAEDYAGKSVSMPDSNTIAIGAPQPLFPSGPRNPGRTRIYRWSGSNWIQKGMDINGDAVGSASGYSVSMPDSSTIAIGSPYSNFGGKVRIYYWSGSNWIQRGADIVGEGNSDWSGYAVSMPNSTTVAIGAPFNIGNGSFSSTTGHVRIYRWNSQNWVQKGNDIDGENISDFSGSSVDMPTPDVVAIGALYNDGNGRNSGHVRIFEWNGISWNQKGSDIEGEDSLDLLGGSLSMPDVNTVAIGAEANDGNGLDAGHVRVFKWNGVSWIQKGSDIDGEAAADLSGASVCMPDTNTIAIGAPMNDGNGQDAGHVRIYKYQLPTALQKNEKNNSLSIYPNPAGNQININASNFIGERVQIFDITGSIQMDFILSNEKEVVDISRLSNGVYFLRLAQITKKLIVTN